MPLENFQATAPPPQLRAEASGPGGVDIHAWTESTVSAMAGLNIASSVEPAMISTTPTKVPVGSTVAIDIPLDAPEAAPRQKEDKSPYLARREPRRRDSLKRREALLKGKEGSRRRQKWENDRLIGNPWFEPPEPHDWEPRPTYPVQSVPYVLAPLWDARRLKAEKRAMDDIRQRQKETEQNPTVPRMLRQTLKRARGAKGLLQDLEEQVREFVRQQARTLETSEQRPGSSSDADFDKLETSDSEEDEIVFVGRRRPEVQQPQESTAAASAGGSGSPRQKADKMIFDTLEDDRGGNFGRWLVHELASYYDLQTWSVTTGDPARREAYVAFKPDTSRRRCLEGAHGAGSQLPKPLYGMV